MQTTANQYEVSIKQYKKITCFLSKETKAQSFMIPLATADNNNFILRTPLFEKYIRNFFFQDSTKNFKRYLTHQSTIPSFITLVEKISPFFSKPKKPTHTLCKHYTFL